METNFPILNIKEKISKKYFDINKNNSNKENLEREKEKIEIYLELINMEKDNLYELKLLEKPKNIPLKTTKINDENNNDKIVLKSIYDYIFGKQQEILIEMKKIDSYNQPNIFSLSTTIGQLIGNNKKSQNKTKLFKLKDHKEQIRIRAQKMKKKELFLIVHFKLMIVSKNKASLTEEEIVEYFKDEKYKFYYLIEKKSGEKIYESEVFTDNGKFNIVQIPIHILNSDFYISFFSYKNHFGKITTNLKELTNPDENGKLFFVQRLSINHKIKIYNYSTIREEITFLDYINEKIRIGLSIGIDFTISNKPPNEKDSLHCLINDTQKNPYEKAILSCGKILSFYDYDQLFPVYGFGAVVNSKTSYCFNINLEDDPNIKYLENVIKCYHECMKKIFFSGPTYFAPIINKIIENIKIQNSPREYNILMILTDGIIQDMEKTIDALVEGSFYPLSVIIIGIGNADFSKMEKLDGDEIPLISQKGIKRQRDLVQFVSFSKFEGDEEKLAHEVLEEIPRQIIEYYTLNFIYPEMLSDKNQDLNLIKNNIYADNILEHKNSAEIGKITSDKLFINASFKLFDYQKKKTEPKIKNNKNYYNDIDEMFINIKRKKTYKYLNNSKRLKEAFDNFNYNSNIQSSYLPLISNDYMNTLNSNELSEKTNDNKNNI